MIIKVGLIVKINITKIASPYYPVIVSNRQKILCTSTLIYRVLKLETVLSSLRSTCEANQTLVAS